MLTKAWIYKNNPEYVDIQFHISVEVMQNKSAYFKTFFCNHLVWAWIYVNN